ncbi:MAG: serine hydrolase domain-containing protein [Bacteroidota bacterium]|nr:serine hydrolase domain-containing protein [Bacteroidota bacterium]
MIRRSLMNSPFLIIVLALILFNVSTGWSQTNQQEISYDEEVLNEALVNGIVLGIPGLSVAIGKGDSIVWEGTAGYSDLIEKDHVKTNDKFGIGSITKTFIAVVILQLVEEGKLDLDKVPAAYLDLEIVRAVPNTDCASLRELLNHQSGIPTWEFQPEWIRKGRGKEMDLDHTWSKTETLDYISKDNFPADFQAGVRYSYSNTNYTILGLIIEAVTGNDVMTEIRRRIFQPLNIENTFLESFEEVPGGYVHHYHYATPQFRNNAGVHEDFPEIRSYLIETTAANLSPEWAAGGMVSTASDLVRWAQALRDGELLGPSMQKEFFTYHPPVETNDSQMKYMQGIFRLEDYINGKNIIGHSGGTLGFTAMMFWIEGTDIVVVSLANVGLMHSGLSQSSVGLFYQGILLPAVLKYLHCN